jgi:hypothetical protein
MEEIELPFLPGDTGLKPAIELMRHSGGPALVTERRAKPYVLRAEDVIERWNALADAGQDPALTMLGQVVPRARPALLAGNLAELRAHVSLVGDGRYEADIKKMFDDQDTRYAIRAIQNGMVKVITASERFADLLTGRRGGGGPSSGILACEGPPVHYWVSSELRDPAVCNMPHGKRIVRN